MSGTPVRRLPEIVMPEWWHRLGSPNAISLPAWLLEFPVAVLMTLGLMPEGRSDQVAEWLVLGAAATFVVGLVMWAVRRVAYHVHGRPPSPTEYMLGLVLAGVARGTFLAVVATMVGLEHQLWLLPRIVGAITGVLVRFPIASLTVDGALRHRATMVELGHALEREQALAVSSADAIRTYRARLVAETQEQVTAQVRKVAGLVSEPRATAARLHDLVDDVVRPLSRALEQRGVREDELLLGISDRVAVPPVPVRAYLSGIITADPFRPLATVLIIVITPATAMTVYVGAGVMIEAAVAGSLTVGAILLAARRGVRPWLAGAAFPRASAVVLAVWLAAVVVEVLVLWVVPPAPLQSPMSITSELAVVAYALIATAAIVGLALEASVRGLRVASERRLEAALEAVAWAAGRLRQWQWLEHRRLGRLIHGGVQARIVSLALQIELNPPSDIPATITEAASSIHDLLEDDHQASWSEALEQIRAVWDPSITLTIEVSGAAATALARDAVAAQALAAVVGEAITNAVRHGGADTVEVRVGRRRGTLDVVVTNDGQATVAGPPGIGSRLLDNACLSWTLTADPAPTTLRARMACDAGIETRADQSGAKDSQETPR